MAAENGNTYIFEAMRDTVENSTANVAYKSDDL